MADVRHLRTSFNGAAVVRAPAEIDITTAEQLRAALLAAAAGDDFAVVVDMTRTSFCDSSGLQALLRAHKRLGSERRSLRLIIPVDSAVHRIMTLTGLDQVLPCFPSLAAAVTGLPASRPPQLARPEPASAATAVRLRGAPVDTAC